MRRTSLLRPTFSDIRAELLDIFMLNLIPDYSPPLFNNSLIPPAGVKFHPGL